MSGISQRWQLYPANPDLSQKISEHTKLPTLVSQVLLNRGIKSLSEIQGYLTPTSKPPQNFPDDTLKKAADCIDACLKAKKKIYIYGDYDVDGMTSTALMASMLEKLGGDITYYVPHRFNDGYGLNPAIINKLKADGYGLLITLDCGISNANVINKIKEETDCQIVIMDHHLTPKNPPKADAILNPRDLDPGHGCYTLCTIGIVYKFFEFFQTYVSTNLYLPNELDLVALGTIADIADLTGENRRLVQEGLKVLAKRKRPGIDALLTVANFTHNFISPRDVGFLIAPRLNAAGRLAHALAGVNLLKTTDTEEAIGLAQGLQKLNEERQLIGGNILGEALALVEAGPVGRFGSGIVLAGRWHAGVIGITASQLVDKYSRPAVIIAYDNGIARGSARSVGTVDIHHLLSKCSDHFSTFGGHRQAAGFSMPPKNIQAFSDALIDVYQSNIKEHECRKVIAVDASTTVSDLTQETCDILEKLEPFGQGNPQPVFHSTDLKPVEFKTVGDGSHLKVVFTDKEGNKVIDAIGFGLSSKLNLLYNNHVEVVFNLECNEWQGRRRTQLKLIDIK